MPHPLDPTAKAEGYVPQSCDLCPPSYSWCMEHNRCRRHCVCNDTAPTEIVNGSVRVVK